MQKRREVCNIKKLEMDLEARLFIDPWGEAVDDEQYTDVRVHNNHCIQKFIKAIIYTCTICIIAFLK